MVRYAIKENNLLAGCRIDYRFAVVKPSRRLFEQFR